MTSPEWSSCMLAGRPTCCEAPPFATTLYSFDRLRRRPGPLEVVVVLPVPLAARGVLIQDALNLVEQLAAGR
jgi:hypothetical protein